MAWTGNLDHRPTSIYASNDTLRILTTMTKPLGYYCAVTPGDESFLDHLQNQYGSRFEKLTKVQKLCILKLLCLNLLQAEVSISGSFAADLEQNEIIDLLALINQNLPIGEHLSLAEAIINQLKGVNCG